LEKRFPKIQGPPKNDISFATQNRQNAVKALSKKVDLVLVVGAPNSSNSVRLLEVAMATGVKARRIESEEELNPEWFEGIESIGVTAGASAPEDILQGVVSGLKKMFSSSKLKDLKIVQENVTFALPAVLRND